LKKQHEKLQTVSYCQRNTGLEHRLKKFFNDENKTSAEQKIMIDTMKEIGMFQLPENRLDHIKNFRKVV